MNSRSTYFVLISYQIVTLAYGHSYLLWMMLNNGKRKIIYDNYKLFCHYKLHNDDIIPNKLTITAVVLNITTN